MFRFAVFRDVWPGTPDPQRRLSTDAEKRHGPPRRRVLYAGARLPPAVRHHPHLPGRRAAGRRQAEYQRTRFRPDATSLPSAHHGRGPRHHIPRHEHLHALPGTCMLFRIIGRVSLAHENEAGAVGGRKSIVSMLTYRTLFCFWL